MKCLLTQNKKVNSCSNCFFSLRKKETVAYHIIALPKKKHFVKKQEVNNEGPKSNVVQTEFCSVMHHDLKDFCTVRSPEEDVDWGMKVFLSKSKGGLGYADYLANNPFTCEGRDASELNKYKED